MADKRAADNRDVAREYAARQAKAARFSAWLYARNVHSSQASLLPYTDPFWGLLATDITRESKRKLLPPHSQETVDLIVSCLVEFEEARGQSEVAQGAEAFDFRSI